MSGRAFELPREISVVNVGLSLFADALAEQGISATGVDWRIPASGDPELVGALRRLCGPHCAAVDAANSEVVRRLDTGVPMLTGIQPAGEAIPALSGRTLLHPGPPLELHRACDPLRRSMRAAIVAEGWAADAAAAEGLLTAGEVTLLAANDHGVVVPMATAIGPADPVWVVELETAGVAAYAPLGQGPGDVAWFGRDTEAAADRLIFLQESVAPVLSEALVRAGPLDVFSFAAQAVAMGDDVHVRTQAATNLLLRHLLPHLVAGTHAQRVDVARFLSENYLFFLTLAMAASRAITAWAGQVEGSSVVTTMARNGSDFGIQLPGTNGWLTAPAPMVGRALFHPGRGPADGAPDIGDSAVLELVGLGAAAAAGSPAVGQIVGGMTQAAALTAELDRVCVARSTRFTLPGLGDRGTPLGVDVRSVVEFGVTPKVTTGILHVSDGSGQVGAGVAEAPVACFNAALLDLDARLTGRGG